jgi:hypothetical protein
MEDNIDTTGFIRRYLLGMLGQEEQAQFEVQLLADGECFEELLVAEDELIDDYINGALSEPERQKFEHYFLASPERQQKIRFARTLKNYIAVAEVIEAPAADKNKGPGFWNRLISATLYGQGSMRRFSLAALLVIVLCASWVVIRNIGVQNPAGQGTGSTAIAVTLSPGVMRSAGEIKRIDITPDVSTVELQLELATDEYQSYHAVVQTDEGSEIITANRLEPKTIGAKRAVIVDLPARLLTGGDYQVKLSGLASGGALEDVGKYYFRVIANGLRS